VKSAQNSTKGPLASLERSQRIKTHLIKLADICLHVVHSSWQPFAAYQLVEGLDGDCWVGYVREGDACTSLQEQFCYGEPDAIGTSCDKGVLVVEAVRFVAHGRQSDHCQSRCKYRSSNRSLARHPDIGNSVVSYCCSLVRVSRATLQGSNSRSSLLMVWTFQVCSKSPNLEPKHSTSYSMSARSSNVHTFLEDKLCMADRCIACARITACCAPLQHNMMQYSILT